MSCDNFRNLRPIDSVRNPIVAGPDRGMLLVSDVKVMLCDMGCLLIGYHCVQHICMNHLISGERVF